MLERWQARRRAFPMQASSIKQLANSMQWRLAAALRERDAAAADKVCADLRRLSAEIERLNASAGAVRTLIAQERDPAWRAANPTAYEDSRRGVDRCGLEFARPCRSSQRLTRIFRRRSVTDDSSFRGHRPERRAAR